MEMISLLKTEVQYHREKRGDTKSLKKSEERLKALEKDQLELE